MANLYLMCGLPGSGKTTFIKEKLKKDWCGKIVHRDDIRKKYLKEGQDYFANEKKVRQEFYKTINDYLKQGYSVIADQTSLTLGARELIFKSIYEADNISCFWFDVDLETALERNEKRKGEKFAYVPPQELKKMARHMSVPSTKEGFLSVFRVDKDGNWNIV